MLIADLPNEARPRERLLAHGSQALSDSELLAIILNHGSAGKSASDLAQELLEHYGGLRQLLNASYSDLKQHNGIGQAKYCQLQAALELSRRHLYEPLKRFGTIHSSQEVHTFLMASLRCERRECFACLYLDLKHRVIEFETLFEGSIGKTRIYPRELIQKALTHNAAALIIAHNHPSGDCRPSDTDLHMTRTLANSLKYIDINLLDHVIIGADSLYSFAEQGLL